MAPPRLPDTSLVIAPNKMADSNKKKRPAFRPGAKKKSARTREKANSAAVSSSSSQTRKTSVVIAENGTKKFELKGTDDLSPESGEGTETLTPPIKNHTEASGKPEATRTRLPSEETAKTTKENAELRNKPTISRGMGQVTSPSKRKGSAEQLILKADHKSVNSADGNSEPRSPPPKRTTRATSKLSGSRFAGSGAKPLPLNSGRKPKSTGLVIGSSRVQAASQPKAPAPTEDAAIASAALINVPLEPATKAVATIPLQLPAPKDGEVALGQFCTKFKAKPRKRAAKGQAVGGNKKKKDENEKKKDTKPVEPASTGPVVQIINGEIVLQESSMVVHKGGQSGLADGADDEEYAVVEEDNEMAVVGASYNSFVNRNNKPQHWSIEETKLFYEALRQVGTDFLLMLEFYPHRTRKQLKRKYQRESTKNPKLVEMALHPDQQKPLDLSIFQVNATDIEQVKLQQQEKEKKEKAAKQEEEESPSGELKKNLVEKPTSAGTVKNDATDEKENGREVLMEDDDNDGRIGDKKQRAHAEESLATALGSLSEEEPLWPAVNKKATAEDDVMVEEDTAMLEEFHHPDAEIFDDIPAHEDDNADIIDGATRTIKEKNGAGSKPAAGKEPAISLVPTTKKKETTNKPKFRSARATKKKK